MARSTFFFKRKDINEESKRKLFVDNNARFYGLEFRTCLNSIEVRLATC